MRENRTIECLLSNCNENSGLRINAYTLSRVSHLEIFSLSRVAILVIYTPVLNLVGPVHKIFLFLQHILQIVLVLLVIESTG